MLEAGLITPGAPASIGPYKVLRPLGKGGMGEVYLAAQEHGVRRLVAVKRIRDAFGSASILERFRVEQQALAVLEHPGIARIFEASVDE
ncbi:MAG: serine/threonine protein kinase, partial [Myxococcales bacterium]|nr:serine/threonine protein kinase [Myxococcales bacterium]